jgi:hypothetical protein
MDVAFATHSLVHVLFKACTAGCDMFLARTASHGVRTNKPKH